MREDHWRYVASILRRLRPVAVEVLDDYPALAQFYAQNLVAAQTQAERLAVREANDNPDDPHVWLSWNPQEGMFLKTRGKEQAIIDAVHGLRGLRFKWSRNLGHYYRPQSVGVSESTVDIDRVADQLRAAGLVVAVERGELGTLGAANARRQDHKFWRAEGYAGRAESALGKADERIGRAEQIRSDLPVGAATARAERAEARADRAEEKATEHLGYVAHAASAAQSLAYVAAGYDTTVEITRKQAEKRADAFAALFVHKAKGLTGAVNLSSYKRDNLSEYSISWTVGYPPSAGVAASVRFNGRVVEVETALMGTREKSIVLQEDVTYISPEEVFEKVIAAMPKYAADATALAPTDPKVFAVELSLYGKKRTPGLAKAMGEKAAYIRPAGKDRWGSRGWIDMEFGAGGGGYGVVDWHLSHLDGMRFQVNRTRMFHTFNKADVPMGALDIDFAGTTIAEAWEIVLAAVQAIVAGVVLVLPKRKAAKGRSPSTAHGSGVVGTIARDVASIPARERQAEIREQLAPLVAVAAERREQLIGAREGTGSVAAARAVAESAGKSHGFYPTPPTLAKHVVELAQVHPGDNALEPSAGMGALVGELLAAGVPGPHIAAWEFQYDRANYLKGTYAPMGVRVAQADFMAMPASPVCDVVVMNPPFSTETARYTDAEHVTHALGFLKPGGRLVAIMSPGSTNPDNPKRRALHAALASLPHRWEPVDAKRFRISGTDIASVILVAHAPKANRRPTRRR